jgi:hypothetical protein
VNCFFTTRFYRFQGFFPRLKRGEKSATIAFSPHIPCLWRFFGGDFFTGVRKPAYGLICEQRK